MSTDTPPRAPRSMIQRARADPITPSEILAGEAGKLYPRLALYEALTKFKDGPTPRRHSNEAICEGRRDFLDSFAYLCDIEKGGSTVTAAALQELPLSNILWLAANEGIQRDIEIYARSMISKLTAANHDNHVIIEDDIVQLAVGHCSPRIKFYKDRMQKHARNCGMQLRQGGRDDEVTALGKKLRRLSKTPSSMKLLNLVDHCYALRGAEVELIRKRSSNDADDFSRLAHYVGRLGATRSAAKTVVRATLIVPALRKISDIRTVKAPEALEVRIDSDYMSPYEIVRAICMESTFQNPTQIQSSLHAIADHDLPSSSKIRSALKSRQVIVTRVHAELQIADKFSRNQHMRFADNDKYVGCSKSACYFCYNWISNHKHRYVQPATHHKIISGCRGPDSDINEAGETFLRDMYARMRGRLNQDILEFLLNSRPGQAESGYHYMSTEGSSRAPSRMSSSLLDTLYVR